MQCSVYNVIFCQARLLPKMCLLTEVEPTTQTMLLPTSSTAPTLLPSVQRLKFRKGSFDDVLFSSHYDLYQNIPGGLARCLCAW